MKPSLPTLFLLLVCVTGLVPYGESQYEDEQLPLKRTWPMFSFPMPHYRLPQHPKAMKKASLISPDCIKAKLGLSDCVKEKLVSTWFSEPLVKDCCDPIANHKKSCPGFIVEIDELLVPHYIKNACHASDHSGKHASGPSAGPSAAPPSSPSAAPSSGPSTTPK